MNRATPNHVLFADTVIGVTRLPQSFDRPFWIQRISASPIFHAESGDWINGGDVVCSFSVEQGWFRSPVSVNVLSPISGRLLHTNDSLCFSVSQHNNFLDYLFLIEVPRGERVPSDSSGVFREFSRLIWENRRRIFQKPRDSRFQAFTDEVVAKELKALRNAPLTIVPSSVYRERIEWLNLHKPHGIGNPRNLERTWE